MKPDIELALPARAENIAIVRHALGGLGEVFGISEEKLSDIRLAVTEACSNVVVHAYPEHPRAGNEKSPHPDTERPAIQQERPNGWGTMQICATMVGDELAVTVRDWGEGIRPRPDSPGLGLGLSLIAALAQTVQLGHDTSEHTEVRMTFALSEENGQQSQRPDPASAAVVSARPDTGPLSAGELSRMSDRQA